MSTVYIFGAGATRGASFVREKAGCKPPLDADFYNQLQRIANPKHQDLIEQVISDAVEMFGSNFRVTLEMMFATLEYTTRMVQAIGRERAFKQSDLEQRKINLMQALAATLEESLTTDGSSVKMRPCEAHGRIVDDMQRADTVVSFNYDCLIDYALKERGNRKWNARYGYCFNLGSKGAKLSGDLFWQPSKPASRQSTIQLLKLHGSLNFYITEPEKVAPTVKLKQRPYTRQHGDLRFTIIPPESNKRFDSGVFATLWKRASEAIYRANTIVVVGYSLPSTDLHSAALLRTSVRKGGLRSVVIVNPDRDARRRTRENLHRGITSTTRVLSFETIEEFSRISPEVWRRDNQAGMAEHI